MGAPRNHPHTRIPTPNTPTLPSKTCPPLPFSVSLLPHFLSFLLPRRQVLTELPSLTHLDISKNPQLHLHDGKKSPTKPHHHGPSPGQGSDGHSRNSGTAYGTLAGGRNSKARRLSRSQSVQSKGRAQTAAFNSFKHLPPMAQLLAQLLHGREEGAGGNLHDACGPAPRLQVVLDAREREPLVLALSALKSVRPSVRPPPTMGHNNPDLDRHFWARNTKAGGAGARPGEGEMPSPPRARYSHTQLMALRESQLAGEYPGYCRFICGVVLGRPIQEDG